MGEFSVIEGILRIELGSHSERLKGLIHFTRQPLLLTQLKPEVSVAGRQLLGYF